MIDHAPGKSTIHRVLQLLDADALVDIPVAWSKRPAQPDQALAGDGKRIDGVNRHGHDGTATLIEHDSHIPLAMRGFRDSGGELAAMSDLRERANIAGRTITLDALHTTKAVSRSLGRRHGSNFLPAVKGNARQTLETLSSIDWEAERGRR